MIVDSFIFQSDDVCHVEKSIVRHASMLAPAGMVEIRGASLTDIKTGKTLPSPATVPVGTVEFCRAWMQACGVGEPAPMDYPECLLSYLGRPVRFHIRYAEAPVGHWVKPVRTKAWDAHIKSALRALTPFSVDLDAPAWSSPPIPILAEWRAYVSHGVLHGLGRYDDRESEIDEAHQPGLTETLPEMIAVFDASGDAPVAYALDVALLLDRRLVLMEVTDAWAIGFYRGSCKPLAYARMLAARWQQIASHTTTDKLAEQPQTQLEHKDVLL